MATTPLAFFVREPTGLSLLIGPPFEGEPSIRINRIPCASARFSNDGSKLAVTTADVVGIYDTSTGSEIQSVKVEGVMAAIFSPRGTYMQTFQRSTGQQKNLTLWDVRTGAIVFQQFQKTMSKSNWPTIQFCEDETVACRLVTNEVHIFDAGDFSKGIVERLRLPGIESVQLAASPPSHIAAFVPEIKGSPASVRIFERSQVGQGQPVARRSFYKASSAQLLWNHGSTGLLVIAQSDIDKTNQSYYGETRLHFLTSNGNHEGSVPLSKEGPVHDVQWAPNGTEFLVVYGYMPAKATLYDIKCKPLFDFGAGPYNTVRWNPDGKFICLAGFGNLPGAISFWDRTMLKKLGDARAEWSVTSEWSADGRYFMTATTAPRLQVDNGMKIFNYDGSLYFEKKYDKLFQAEWQPAAAGTYLDQPSSPLLLSVGQQHSASTDLRNTGQKQKHAPSKSATSILKPAAYQPPHAKSSASARAQLFGEDENSLSGSTRELSKSALKNRKRREKQKEKNEMPESGLAASEISISAVGAQLEGLPASLNCNADSSGDDAGKRLRSLHKKLRQIEEIKQKILETGGSYSLASAQQEKLAQEASVREEIRILETQQKI